TFLFGDWLKRSNLSAITEENQMKKSVKSEPQKAPEPTTFEMIKESLGWEIASSNQTLDAFLKNFQNEPGYAFEWAGQAMTAGARKDIRMKVLRFADDAQKKGQSPAEFLDAMMTHLTEKAIHEARYPTHSPSPISTEMARMNASAAIELVDTLKN